MTATATVQIFCNALVYETMKLITDRGEFFFSGFITGQVINIPYLKRDVSVRRKGAEVQFQ